MYYLHYLKEEKEEEKYEEVYTNQMQSFLLCIMFCGSLFAIRSLPYASHFNCRVSVAFQVNRFYFLQFNVLQIMVGHTMSIYRYMNYFEVTAY